MLFFWSKCLIVGLSTSECSDFDWSWCQNFLFQNLLIHGIFFWLLELLSEISGWCQNMFIVSHCCLFFRLVILLWLVSECSILFAVRISWLLELLSDCCQKFLWGLCGKTPRCCSYYQNFLIVTWQTTRSIFKHAK